MTSLRVSPDEELKGLDKSEHGVGDDAHSLKARQAAARAYWRRRVPLLRLRLRAPPRRTAGEPTADDTSTSAAQAQVEVLADAASWA